MGLIETIKNSCHECYACVRNCPVKAVRVSNGQAEVLEERCIHCGNCVRICAQKAKKVLDYKDLVKEYLQQKERVVIGLAPSFPAFDTELEFSQWIEYLTDLGFTKIYEVAWGAQLVIEEIKKNLQSTENDLLISSACPVIVNLIEKYYPSLVANLAQVVSPMVALSRYISMSEPPGTKVVLVGPCLAKKKEVERERTIDAILTFSELVELGEELTGRNLGELEHKKKIFEEKELEKDQQILYITKAARKIPLAGGLLDGVIDKYHLFSEGYINVEGSAKVFELFDSLVKGDIQPKFVDILYCDGCINGVDLTRESYFKKEKAVKLYIKQKDCVFPNIGTYSYQLSRNLDLSANFHPDYKSLSQPTERDIWRILNLTNKFTNDDLLNCGACGYSSCKEKAIAVYQGIAEVEMCLSYLLTTKRQEIKEVQNLNKQLDTLINSSYDGMVVINQEMVIERVNDSYLKILGLTAEDIVGKKILDLEKERIVYPAVSTLALHERRSITLVQNTWNGNQILASATPIFDEQNNVLRVLVNTRDICLLNELEMQAKEGQKICQYIRKRDQVELQEGPGHIVYTSSAMKKILKLACKIARTSSNVLITGESGVGKEVIASYIHEQSGRKNNFVKINCGAIPETLLESELFGYETGAFSGAKRDGKPGLIELAHQGTLFLDEIGEMPLNLQVKLLQVLQGHWITRLGGVEKIKVDFRLIVATNRDLKKMILEKQFREDLYYRLNVVPIFIPGLRFRKEDILPLVKYWLNQNNHKYEKNITSSSDAEKLLIQYHWPGNIRELANLMERIVVTSEERVISAEKIKEYLDLKTKSRSTIMINEVIPLEEAVTEVEKKLLQLVKKSCKSTYEMAEKLGVNQSTVVRKMKKYFS
ncbi:MAG: sigma 54-interacting transcriptional regulator [Halanaerobiales bacterium]|nr:sigma 54-interacting transcriptional regulator [Halanaerobiales bacterium]